LGLWGLVEIELAAVGHVDAVQPWFYIYIYLLPSGFNCTEPI